MAALAEHAPFLSPLVSHVQTLNLNEQDAFKAFIGELGFPTAVGGGLFKKPAIICPLLISLCSPQARVCLDTIDKLRRAFPALLRLVQTVPDLATGFPAIFYPLFLVRFVSIYLLSFLHTCSTWPSSAIIFEMFQNVKRFQTQMLNGFLLITMKTLKLDIVFQQFLNVVLVIYTIY
jgi:hypothetical protein